MFSFPSSPVLLLLRLSLSCATWGSWCSLYSLRTSFCISSYNFAFLFHFQGFALIFICCTVCLSLSSALLWCLPFSICAWFSLPALTSPLCIVLKAILVSSVGLQFFDIECLFASFALHIWFCYYPSLLVPQSCLGVRQWLFYCLFSNNVECF